MTSSTERTGPVGSTASGVPGRGRRAQIVGLGLIGSSIGLALRGAGWTVTGDDVDRERAARALSLGVVDVLGRDLEPEVAFIATPVAAIVSVANELLSTSSDPELVVTDVGGVKGPVVSAVGDPRFVGGHPMAGSEQEGPDGADPDLFAGATWVLTPTSRTDQQAYARLRGILATLGSEVVALAPEHHDALVAVVSHVPHLAAAVLMALAADASEEHAALLPLAAGGFRDMTRVAAGDPAIWPDIFADNALAVLEVLDDLRARLDEARRIVATGDRDALSTLLARARLARRSLPSRALHPEELVEIRFAVPDRAGVLAEVTTVLGALGVNISDIEIAHSAEGERGVLELVVEATAADKARGALVELGYRPAARRLG